MYTNCNAIFPLILIILFSFKKRLSNGLSKTLIVVNNICSKISFSTQISAQQPWTARGRSGHLCRVPHCREIVRRNEKMLGPFITRKKSPTLS